ncbi:FimV/HubP family polar landmark protein [Shewanella sp. Isolate11]|uniref:FimV/HubP family polar landmark protein n=1 Tax=Shewanella sp. Isolate11 TaxID=2908530 RepID=UPI001EFE99CC|nr:FimV/HubP family polar landmark protein [Shewanella sp. Isolate11]MCG9695468.1 hypothetical protein [Shewanella sp. Isolate11]
MRRVLIIVLTSLLLFCQSSLAEVNHVSINKQLFALGKAPMLKVNIVTQDSRYDELQFIVSQRSGDEVLMVSPLNDYLYQLTGFEDVTDKDALLIVKEHYVNRWREVKRLRLFDGRDVRLSGDSELDEIMYGRTRASQSNRSASTAVATAQKRTSGKLNSVAQTGQVKPQCLLDYQGKRTLWRVASQYAPQWGLNTYGAMLAIFDANPKAFNDSNINGLRADIQLNCPAESVINKYQDAKVAKQTFEAMSS